MVVVGKLLLKGQAMPIFLPILPFSLLAPGLHFRGTGFDSRRDPLFRVGSMWLGKRAGGRKGKYNIENQRKGKSRKPSSHDTHIVHHALYLEILVEKGGRKNWVALMRRFFFCAALPPCIYRSGMPVLAMWVVNEAHGLFFGPQ